MSNLLKSSGAVLLVVWSSACGSDVNVGAGGSGGGGGGGEGGQDPACVPFNDEESAGPVTFRVVNQSGADLYLQGACDSLSYSVDPITGPDGSFYGNVGGACQQSCEQLQHEDPLLCAADACAPSSILVASGTSRDFTWGGQGQRSTEMPASCFFSPEFRSSRPKPARTA